MAQVIRNLIILLEKVRGGEVPVEDALERRNADHARTGAAGQSSGDLPA